MIRDGYTYDKKRIRKDSKVFDVEYQTDLFVSVLHSLNNFLYTGNYHYFSFLRDPYAMLFCAKPELLREIHTKKDNWEQIITCKEVYETIKEGRTEEISLHKEEREILKDLQQLKIPINEEKLLKSLIRNRPIDKMQVKSTWILQPNIEAIIFAIASRRAEIETVTPVIGIPIRLMTSTNQRNKIRFPCVIEPKIDGKHVQIHKTAEKYTIFDKNGEILKEKLLNFDGLGDLGKILSQNNEIIAPNQGSYVVDGVLTPENEVKVFDILALNDIWFNNRPLSERLKHEWRFYPHTVERFVVWGWEEMKEVTKEMGDFVVKNLNKPYDPTSRDAWISTEVDTVRLQVSNIKHHSNETFLVTKEKIPLFTVKKKLGEDLLKKCVEIRKEGKVVNLLNSNYLPDGIEEIMLKWNIKERKEMNEVRPCRWENVNI